MTACVGFLRHVCCAQEAFLGMSLDINKVLSMATKLGNNLEGHEMYPAITRDRQRDLFKKLLYFGSKQIVKLMGELKRCSNWRKSE